MIAALVCGGLLALAVLVEAAPGPGAQRLAAKSKRRRPAGRDPRRRGSSGRSRGGRSGRGRGGGRGRSGGGPDRVGPRGRAAATTDVAGLMTEVAARLRAGAPVSEAWGRALERAGLDAGDLEEAGAPRHATPSLPGQLAAVRAATALAERVGAPLADVLERCADGVAAAGRAESARRVALAGPASTARLLSALPVVGVLVGTALGADPVEALLDGGLGTAAASAGLGLLVLGHRWTSVLVAAARQVGSDGSGG